MRLQLRSPIRTAHCSLRNSIPRAWATSSQRSEYGQLDAFVAIDPNTGEVLPPEEPTAAAWKVAAARA